MRLIPNKTIDSVLDLLYDKSDSCCDPELQEQYNDCINALEKYTKKPLFSLHFLTSITAAMKLRPIIESNEDDMWIAIALNESLDTVLRIHRNGKITLSIDVCDIEGNIVASQELNNLGTIDHQHSLNDDWHDQIKNANYITDPDDIIRQIDDIADMMKMAINKS